ncbi:MAG TPA: LmbU family transcriptional regulator [Longimicrobiales bacterium]|nr:LmbU family transcriptional regulator [Longimicrobiales bacterium]
MSLDLARIEQRARLTPAGLELPPDLAYDDWEDVGRSLRAIEGAVQWWIGDWLNYGERKYGERYTQAIEATGYAYDTLAGAAYVARQIESCRRRQNLSWSHHKEVAALDPPEQDALLSAAADGEWSRNELRRAVKVYKRREAAASLPPERRTCSVEDLSVLSGRGDRFATIYADPPWQYGNQATRASTDNHYSTMAVDEICGLPVAQLATENAHLHLWTTNAFLHDAMTRVMPSWGFEYKSMFI